jgi:hypothetical protein
MATTKLWGKRKSAPTVIGKKSTIAAAMVNPSQLALPSLSSNTLLYSACQPAVAHEKEIPNDGKLKTHRASHLSQDLETARLLVDSSDDEMDTSHDASEENQNNDQNNVASWSSKNSFRR